ncbi:IMPACT family protein [Aurantibacillus circumpalustris]|uniref:IMPACT family protein n=1 Tax=Aurantibacillus circumpalustris TaxID=3036359 RepID=UPI00295AB04E|nr:YigZ family protein [Aurantibacillus circumpalustris]
MLFSDSYITITDSAQGVFKDKGSKFLAFAWPVKTELEVKEHLLQLKKEHPSANHLCYAWRLGPDKLAYRTNDDGEPSNTAGKPIFSQIQANDLTDVLIVVVRYFGGTLLGVSGLINAYKNAAEDVLKGANLEEKFILYEYKIEFDFDVLSAVMRLFKECEAKIISTTYEEKNAIVFHVKKLYADRMETKFQELYTTKLKFLKMV